MSREYFDNKILVPIYVNWKEGVLAAKVAGTEPPEMPRELQLAILALAKNMSNRFNFVNYSYRDLIEGEMIEVLVKYPLGFDTSKGNNLFGYWSRFAFNAGRQRIKKEKLQQKIKVKILKQIDVHELLESEEGDNVAEFQEYINNNMLLSDTGDEEKFDHNKPTRKSKNYRKDEILDKLFAFTTKPDDDDEDLAEDE